MPNRPIIRRAALLLIAAVVLILAGCGSGAPYRDTTDTLSPAQRSEIVLTALEYLDTPYRYGGTGANGLDCSALVQRAYRQVGRSVPRSTREQARAARRISPSRMQPGDVVFFAIDGRQISHVGIYLGDGRFIHAPSSRSRVRIELLDNPYWQPRLRFAGHFL